MNKKMLLIVGILLIICLGIGGKMYMDKKRFQEDMITVVKSDEAKVIFEQGLTNLDPKAFTPGGIIQSYKINFESINHNPMGGINVTLVINNNNDLTTEYDIDKGNDGLKGGGIVISPLLTKQIDGEYYE